MSSTTTHQAHAAVSQPRALNIALWVLQVVTAAGFLLAAVAKIAAVGAVVAVFDAIGFGDWFRYAIAVLEIAGAVGLLVPRLAGAAGLAFVGLMLGALMMHLTVIGSGAGTVIPLLALAAVIAWGRRSTTKELLDTLSR